MNSRSVLQAMIGLTTAVLLLIGCGPQRTAPATTSVVEAPAATPTPVPPMVTPTPVPPTPTHTPIPPTPTPTPPPVVLGYIEDIPAAFVQPESGLIVEIPEVTYAETGALESYKENVRYTSGEVLELEFYDFVHTETGLVDGYATSLDGVVMKGPSKSEFKSISEIETKIAFAPDHFLPVISVTCTGQVESNVEYAYTDEGAQQVASHELICSDQQKAYDLQYSEYTYDEIGRLSGFSVHVEILPTD